MFNSVYKHFQNLAIISFLISISSISIAKPIIYTGVVPVAGIVKALSGNRFDVYSILPPAGDHDTFSPNIKEIVNIAKATALFTTTLPFEATITDKISKLYNNISIFNLNKALDNLSNPHVWLSFKNLKTISKYITDNLIQIDPENKTYYNANLEKYNMYINKSYEIASANIKHIKYKKLYEYHPSFDYFANDFNIDIQHLEEYDAEPSISDITNIRKEMTAGNGLLIIEKSEPLQYMIDIAKSQKNIDYYIANSQGEDSLATLVAISYALKGENINK